MDETFAPLQPPTVSTSRPPWRRLGFGAIHESRAMPKVGKTTFPYSPAGKKAAKKMAKKAGKKVTKKKGY